MCLQPKNGAWCPFYVLTAASPQEDARRLLDVGKGRSAGPGCRQKSFVGSGMSAKWTNKAKSI